MRTAIDTNVLSALWSNEKFASKLAEQLAAARSEGGLVISAPVYAEMLAHPGATEAFATDFLASTGIDVDYEFSREAWLQAGRRFARYANRRRKSTGTEAKRLLADFIIGSHALTSADRFMTLDPKRYQRDFPELALI